MNDLIDMLYIEYTKKCNSKCSTCDYWLNKKEELVVSDKEIIVFEEPQKYLDYNSIENVK